MSVLDNYGGDPFDDLFDVALPVYGVEDVEVALSFTPHVVGVIWGGADISPSIYKHRVSRFTGGKETLSTRDAIEVTVARHCIEKGIPLIGVCRGAQLLCALSGGSLIQHVDNHAGGYHPIVTSDGEILNCPSLHHQMMYPWYDNIGDPIEHEMLAWMEKPRSDVYYGQPDEDGTERSIILPGPEPEVVWFPKTKSLCIQSHPEFIHQADHPFRIYCNKLVSKYLLGEEVGSRAEKQ